MEISREDLQSQYEKLSDSQLLEIYAHRNDYTDMAVEVMTREIKLRNLEVHREEMEIDEPLEVVEPEVVEAVKLRFAEKLVAYFCFPFILIGLLFFFFLLDPASRQVYQGKVNQAFFFVLYSSFIVVFLALLNSFSILNWHIEIWAAGFLIPFFISVRSSHRRKNMADEINHETVNQPDEQSTF